jgi:hypothetical protein
VSISDVSLLISIALGQYIPDADTRSRADIDGDNSIDISDVSELIAIVLSV